jgi:hypothetical protein
MRRIAALALVSLFVIGPAGTGLGAPRMVELGTDPAGDGLPALDVTYLQVGKAGANLEIRIGIDKMLPVLGGYPAAPGIEWVFEVKQRTFIAEVVAGTPEPDFYLFEEKDGSFTQLASPQGTYDSADGYASVLVPLKTIGARRGVTISGVEGREHGDVDAHVHLGVTDYYPDGMQTTRSYVVP